MPRVIADRYELADKPLSSGQFGVVYRAKHLHTQDEFAIKLFRVPDNPGVAANARKRFIHEAWAAGNIRTSRGERHPNVIEIYDVGVDQDGTCYLVEELMRGHDLGKWLAQRPGPTDPAVTYQIVRPVVDALAAAHAAGIAHRDIKPDNVFVLDSFGDEPFTIKLFDFGVAKLPLNAGTHSLVGTLAYMPPETLQGIAEGETMDVWAVGVTLIEILVGQHPLVDWSETELSTRELVDRMSDPLNRVENLPVWQRLPASIRGVISKCLEFDPAARYANAGDLLLAIDFAWALPVQVALDVQAGETAEQVSERARGLAAGVWTALRLQGSNRVLSEMSSLLQLYDRAPLDALEVVQPERGDDLVAALAAWHNKDVLRRLALRGLRLEPPQQRALASVFGARLARLELRNCQLSDATVESLARSDALRQVEALDLSSNPLGDDALAALAGSAVLSELRSLTVENLVAGPAGVGALVSSSLVKGLRSLHLRGTRAGDDGVARLAEGAANRLERLDVGRSGLTQRGALALLHAETLPLLTDLDLSGLQHDAGAAMLFTTPTALKRLRTLKVQGAGLDDGSVERLATLGGCELLIDLDLRANILGPASAKHIASRCVHRLRRLSLAENRVGDEGAAALAASRRSAYLAHLDLFANGIGGGGVRALAGSAFFSSLETLDLSANPIGDEGARMLASSLGLDRLHTLRLRGCELGPAGAIAIATSPRLRSLRLLELNGNPSVTDVWRRHIELQSSVRIVWDR